MPALLFDLDGTMLVSDPIHEAVFRELFAARGVALEEDFYMRRIHGRQNRAIFAEMLPDEPDPAALDEQKEAMFRARLPRPYPAMPGLAALVAQAEAKGWGLAIVTNAMRKNAEAMLSAIGLREAFGIIVSSDDCAHGKPDPAPYRQAMRLTGEPPAACIAFEDSAAGVRAAAAAGAYTIGIRSALDDATLRAAGAVASIQDFEDPALPDHLARLEGGPT
ncbi:HAD family hydrolase [Sinisalibacter aestuarii]|uniref:Haloacid dehalogenase n=1 Tax=Sinisalibacter aestuarii TaxID=2949426 RepID=A0ABQ5LSL1_9RHOB|nr:HAD family phosphatase [Sinisalibacter aestuarii]GKY87909.1 haloacid dehalogenase [Sinisalibacter aestuarii]